MVYHSLDELKQAQSVLERHDLYVGGVMRGMVPISRVIERLEQRIAELEEQLETAKEDAIAEYDRIINRELMKQGRTLNLRY